MSNPRNRILASTALALVLAAPLGYLAKGHLTAMAATTAEPAAAQFAPAVTAPANEPAATNSVPATATEPAPSAQPAAAAEQTAIEPAVAPDPLAALDPADRAVAENIRDLLATKGDKLFTAKKERAAVEAFYQNRNLAPLWLDKGIQNARAEAVIARMKNADADGLEPGDYKAPSFAVSKNIELPQAAPEPADVLSNVADAANAGKALDAYSPQNEHYRKLKAALADLRGKPGASKGQIETITANMERWRWYARDLGNAYSLVNLPDFTLRVMHNGGQVWTTRIVIGKPSMPTPLLSETMKYLTVNPTWTVPQSIVRNEYLPALAQDPTVLDRMGLRVSYNGGGVTITQPPGDGNALGRVRFSFNNRFSVFQHDTPDKGLFSETVRAYSHGCMRVQDPPKYAEVLLNIARPSEHWTAEKIRRMYGGGERDLPLQATPIWVHLTYQTAFVDNAGKLEMRRDIYGLDGRTIAAIKSERGNLEAAPERKREEIATAPRKPAAPAARTGALSQTTYTTPGYARQMPPSIFR